MKDYKTVKSRASFEFTEKKSRFISFIAYADSEAAATAFISDIISSHRDCSHVVYAYSLQDGQTKRFSDAGEPQGTAGMPTLEAIVHNKLYNVVIATVRYFGGTLLGTGGLTRAYSKAASEVIKSADIIKRTYGSMLEITLPYNLYGKVSPFISTQDCVLTASSFESDVTLEVFVAKGEVESFNDKITDLTNGRAKIEIKENLYFDI